MHWSEALLGDPVAPVTFCPIVLLSKIFCRIIFAVCLLTLGWYIHTYAPFALQHRYVCVIHHLRVGWLMENNPWQGMAESYLNSNPITTPSHILSGSSARLWACQHCPYRAPAWLMVRVVTALDASPVVCILVHVTSHYGMLDVFL